MRIALTALTPKGPADVIVSGDDGATAGQVAEALQEAFAPKEHLASVIMHPRAVAAVRVIGGPDAGTVHRLGPGATTIGSGPGCQVRLLTPGVPTHAATITVAWGLSEPSLEPAGAPAQLVLDGRPVTGAC